MRRHMNRQMLTSEFEYYDPKDDLHDISCGKYLQALSELPRSLKLLLADNSMHIELDEIDGHYQVTKIVKMRDPECVQTIERFFVYGQSGKRIPLTEEEFNNLLGLKFNPEDVYNNEELDLQTLNSEYTCSRDIWDIIFDATEYIREAQIFITNTNNQYYDAIDNLNELKNTDPANINEVNNLQIKSIIKGIIKNAKAKNINLSVYQVHSRTMWVLRQNLKRIILFIKNEAPIILQNLADTLIYSADFFYYSTDKRIHGKRAKDLAQIILKRDLSKQELGKLIGPKESKDFAKESMKMKELATSLPPGLQKVKTMNYAQTLMNKAHYSNKQTTLEIVAQSDRKKLWSMWQEKKIKKEGQVIIPEWQLERVTQAKQLQKLIANETLSIQEASKLLWNKVKVTNTKLNIKDQLPAWLTEATPIQEEEKVDDNEICAIEYIQQFNIIEEQLDEENWQFLTIEDSYQ